MKWLFREMPKNEVERDVTQRSQFDTDEARIEATLIRESHQNSLDARLKSSFDPVRIKITFHSAKDKAAYWEDIFKPLRPHLAEGGVDLSEVDFSIPEFLVIEDFGTTGLTGRWDDLDKEPFTDFWRREGRSHKSGTSNGRWGLGKLVFSSASRIRTFFGLTVRHNDAGSSLLMGETVLSTHEVGGKKYAPYGFFANQGAEGFQLPETTPEEVAKFAAAAGVSRTSESGFSVVIPFPLKGLEPAHLIEGVLKNYFFPILTGQLEVHIQDTTITKDSFEDVAKQHAGVISPALIAFIRQINAHAATKPDLELGPGWTKDMDAAIQPARLESLRKQFATAGEIVHARAPLPLRKKDGTVVQTYFDLFLSKAGDDESGETLFIRSAITVPLEAKFFARKDTFGALLATDPEMAAFLGDAENPAHTQWNASAERLRDKWNAGRERLGEIRASLRNLHKIVAQLEEQVEPDALIDFFSIEDLQAGKRPSPKKAAVAPPIPDIAPSKKSYRIVPQKGGFSIKPGDGLTPETLPVMLKIKTAYDVLQGNPLKKYDPLDFRLDKPPITIKAKGAKWTTDLLNTLEVEVESVDFLVEVRGFDMNRDLMVDARRETR